jgi:hypothetical protein
MVVLICNCLHLHFQHGTWFKKKLNYIGVYLKNWSLMLCQWYAWYLFKSLISSHVNYHCCHICYFNINTPPNSLKDSNVSSKMKATKEGIGVHSLVHNTSRVRRACWSSGMGSMMNDKWVNYSYGTAQTK